MPWQRPKGFTAFLLIWFGQVVSLVGSAMSGFAMTIWAWQITQQATALALVGLANFLPMILFAPVAGVLVDRWPRRLVLILSDLAAGCTTIGLLILYQAGSLQIWHLYVAGVIAGFFQSFQWPAYSSTVSLMVSKEQYGRTSGMIALAEWGSGIFAPVLAGALLGIIGLAGIMTIDIITFTFAISMVLLVAIPPAVKSEEGKAGDEGSFWWRLSFGFRFIFSRPPLLFLQLVFFAGNLLFSIANTLQSPMVLARTGDDPVMLATVQSTAAAGGVLGSLLMTAWGGPKRRVYGVLFGWMASGVLGLLVLGLGGSLPFWMVGAFFGSILGPIINSSNQAIWQAKVPPDIQGRVFSVRLMIAQITVPVAMAVAGPLADQWMEPVMLSAASPLGQMLARVFGSGRGVGMSVIIAAMGLLVVLSTVVSLLNPQVRNVETLLPDHSQASGVDGGAPEPAAQ
ncbi:MAG TPA: MFS transporter [Anaerolineaceae bacterium]|nr:MFS transporter [Anaerolineaceae bacterium]HPN51393.1 MFS transporter [Anaerolineaceae bacterium]